MIATALFIAFILLIRRSREIFGLVAELGAAFLSSSLGINSDAREDHAPYIASWLKVIKSDKKAIFNAASLAQTASNYLLELSSKNSME